MEEGNRDVCFGGGGEELGWEENIIKDGGKQECLPPSLMESGSQGCTPKDRNRREISILLKYHLTPGLFYTSSFSTI